MKVRLARQESGNRYYEVSEHPRWYRVTHDTISNAWVIRDNKQAILDPWGKLGAQIVAACQARLEEIRTQDAR